MTQEGKDKIITRAIHFIATNTNDKSYRIGQAIIAELDLVKKLTLGGVVKSDSELFFCCKQAIDQRCSEQCLGCYTYKRD
jgi:hypothetical protein